MRILSRLPRPLLALPLLMLAACAAVKPRSPLMERIGHSKMSVGELRIRVRDMARRFPVVLEATADEVAKNSDSPETREAMLRFKSNAVPAMQAALLQPDPVAALIDGWAFLVQLEQALPKVTSPKVQASFQKSLGNLESEMEALERELTGKQDVSDLSGLVRKWATEHPLTGPALMRESTAPLLASFTSRSGVGLLGATADLLQDTQDLMTRVDLYAGSLPRQARYQAEIAAQEMVEGTPVLTSAMSELNRAVDVLVHMGALADRTPRWVTGEREALQGFITSERRAVMDEVRGEGQAVLDSIHTERVQALQQTDTMGRGWVDHAFDRAEGLVNHIFLWLLGLVALLVLGALGVAVLLTRGGRRGEGPRWGRRRAVGGPPRDEGLGAPGPGAEHGPPGEHPGEPHH